MADAPELHELILYAEPGGELGARCAELWAAMSAAEVPTTAQEFPPHVSLTGFFERRPDRTTEVLDAVTVALDTAVPTGFDGVRWAAPVELEFQSNDDWTGFHVAADWMDRLIAAFAAAPVARQPGEDAVRPKSWLHVSLAYGDGYDAAARHAVAETTASLRAITAEPEWTVVLWRRDGRTWERLTSADIRAD